MQMYSVASRRIVENLKGVVGEVKQVWYADDCAGAGSLRDLHQWWSHLADTGPLYGYFPNVSKTCIVVKSEEMAVRARNIFGPEIKITTEGKRYVGAALGTEEFKMSYVKAKVEKWVEDVEELAQIAKDEPQAALSAYNTGLSQRWTFLQRTMGLNADLFQSIEDNIRYQLIPALCGRQVNASTAVPSWRNGNKESGQVCI